jgi:hypothetical protein
MESTEKPQIDSQSNTTDAKRQELRDSMRAAMDSGQISAQPETGSWDFVPIVPEPSNTHPKEEHSKDRKAAKIKPKRAPDLNHDSFFETSVD